MQAREVTLPLNLPLLSLDVKSIDGIITDIGLNENFCSCTDSVVIPADIRKPNQEPATLIKLQGAES